MTPATRVVIDFDGYRSLLSGWLDAYQTRLEGNHNQLGSMSCAEFVHRALDVGTHGQWADIYSLGNFVVRQSFRNQCDDFAFPVG